MALNKNSLGLISFFATTAVYLFVQSTKGKATKDEPTNRPIIICGPSGVGKYDMK